MEIRSEEALIEVLACEDHDLCDVVKRHRQLDEMICKLDKKRILTPGEQAERKNLQKKKLAEKDKIQQILCLYRRNERVIY